MRSVVRGVAALVVFGVVLLGSSAEARSADDQPNAKLVEKGKTISRTVAGIGCAGCHGRFGEGDVGIGPYIRGVGLSKIQAAVAAVSQMQIVKTQLNPEDINAVAEYYSWVGQHQLVKALVKRDRFVPDAVDVYPGTAVQFAINNSGQAPRKFASQNMDVAEFQVPGKEVYDFFWHAPEREGAYTLRCVDCLDQGQGLNINVRRTARPYRVPDQEAKK